MPPDIPSLNADPGTDEDHLRIFLVVVDNSTELRAALRYACRRARHTGGRVALLTVVEPAEFQHFSAIGSLMQEEARQEAEMTLQRYAALALSISGHMPILLIREGDRREELLALLAEEPSISILVLAASTEKGGPGPLISALTGKFISRVRIPMTIVPGDLTDAEIDMLT